MAVNAASRLRRVYFNMAASLMSLSEPSVIEANSLNVQAAQKAVGFNPD